MKPMSARTDMRRLIRAAERAGLVYTRGQKHGRLTSPSSGRFISISCTPSDFNAPRRVVADLKKYLNVELQ
jgi:hypothetical protein